MGAPVDNDCVACVLFSRLLDERVPSDGRCWGRMLGMSIVSTMNGVTTRLESSVGKLESFG